MSAPTVPPDARARHRPTYCSAFSDTDRYFGACGSFYEFEPTHGAYEANPPFDNTSVGACFRHVARVLGRSTEPLCFVVVLPEMDFKTNYSREPRTRTQTPTPTPTPPPHPKPDPP